MITFSKAKSKEFFSRVLILDRVLFYGRIFDMLSTDNINAAVGLSTEGNASKAVKEAIMQAKSGIYREKIHLAIVVSSPEFANSITIQTLNELLMDVPIIGCSGAAIITNKGIFRNGLCVMLLNFPKTTSFNAAFVNETSKTMSVKAGEALGDKLLKGFTGMRRDLGIIFSDGMVEDVSNLIYGLQEKLGTSFPLIGGSVSNNLQFLKSYLYFKEQVYTDAACGIILGGKLNFGWGIKHGWKPLGKPRRVTKATANAVYEIENSPAVNIYEEYLALNLTELRNELKRISIFYPIGIEMPGEEEHLLRNIHSIENDGSLIFQDNVPEGSLIRLMIGTKESCLNATHRALNDVKNGLFGRKVSFAFIFNSISRYKLLGRSANKELDIIKEELGLDTPIIGIYTFGEQAPFKAINYHGKTYSHNQTFTVLGIE